MALDLSAGRILERPDIVSDRYVAHGMPGSLPITVTSPASGTRVTSTTVTVSGTTTPDASVVAEAAPPTGGAVPIVSTKADPTTGDWTLTVPVGFATTTITVTATLGRSTGYTQTSVVNFTLPGTTLLNDTDPTGDDNGPGTYQYPTSPDFAPGSFDLTDLQVSQTGTDVYVQVKIRNLVPTFGNSFGAQLVDIYVRNPSATSFSTSAAYPQLNYGIASNSAWSERLEAQGFASPIWLDASGTSLGNPEFVVDDTSGTATLILPQSTFGTVTSSWVFTVALTGQNGFNSYQARDFTQPAGAFTFGVCPVGDTAKICSFNPSLVPDVMDTITPPGVSQDTELNPTLGSVELQGVNGTDTQSGP
ncbi:MAG TPA: glucodextranase DOMON-like domain-containing protein [Solirubrobacteraceae bacterium]|nr:glucodextranase DOMON-like domain-containing protein [Solirubrobacteraceae bacterium]